ncbi:MAG TPA: hypothetical protein VLH37_05665 [Bacteroidales bacterium]|nr:hypothetical protein [Bacteroidales bacterium]
MKALLLSVFFCVGSGFVLSQKLNDFEDTFLNNTKKPTENIAAFPFTNLSFMHDGMAGTCNNAEPQALLVPLPSSPDTLSTPKQDRVPESATLNLENFEDYGKENVDITAKSHFPRFVFIGYFAQADFIFKDFGEFRAALGDSNIDILNVNLGSITFGLSGMFNRIYAGISYGLSNSFADISDSLSIDLEYSKYGLHFGYNLVYSPRFIITPKIAIKWNRHRLINSAYDRRISLDEYLAVRDLDIRFNQLTGFAGLRLAYKMYNPIFLGRGYLTAGVFAGYCFKINDKPWIFSRENRLTTDYKIHVKNLNFGLSVSINLSYY